MFTVTHFNEIKNKENGILFFYANWIPFCRRLFRMISSVEKESNIQFYGVDVDSFPDIAKMYSVNSIPEFVFIKNGKQIHRINGLVMTSALRSSVRVNFADI